MPRVAAPDSDHAGAESGAESNPRARGDEETALTPGSCLGGCLMALAPIAGGIVGLIVGEVVASDELFRGLDVLGYGLMGAAIGLGVGIATFLALSRH